MVAPTAILAMREITSKKYIDSASTSSKPTNSSSTSSRRDREPKSSTSTFKGNTVKSPRGTGAGDRINEVHSSNWVCPNCSLVVYGRRNACFKTTYFMDMKMSKT